MAVYCDQFDGLFKGILLEFAIFLPLTIILQLVLLSNTIYNEYSQRNKKTFQKISKILRILFIVLQIIGLFWCLMDLCRFVIDPFQLMLRNNGGSGCDFAAYTPKVIPTIYYGTYCYQILLRLEQSFKGSYLALSKRTTYMLALLVLMPVILGPTLFFWFNRENSSCVALWQPSDLPHLYHVNDIIPFSFCALPIAPAANAIIMFVMVWVAMINILFGVLFGVKLKNALSTNEANENAKFKFKSLIIKNSILTVGGAISTIISYMLWIAMQPIGLGALFLYLDLFVNCLVIALMFRYNEKYYKRLCKCCIVICFRTCDKTKNKMEDKDVLKWVNNEIELSTTQSTAAVKRISKVKGMIFRKMKSLSSADIDSDVDVVQSDAIANDGNSHLQLHIVAGSDIDEDDIAAQTGNITPRSPQNEDMPKQFLDHEVP